MTAWRSARHSLRLGQRAIPAGTPFLALLTTAALVLRKWWLVVVVILLIVLTFTGQRWIRHRSRRLHAGAALTGGGVWLGRVPRDQAETLWGEFLSLLPFYLLARDGLPVMLVADSYGLTLHPRGMVLTRWKQLTPTLIPWADLAGVRSRHLGLNTEVRQRLWLVGLTKITLDLVGRPARPLLRRLYPPDYAQACRDLDVEPNAKELAAEAEHREDEEAYWRRFYGPDWCRGTRPLEFTTSAPDGLVELVLRRHSGTPAEAVLPET